MIIQLTIGQHEFELRGSTYMQIKKKNTTVLYHRGWLDLCIGKKVQKGL